jgi:hypothetical protein
MQVHLQEYEKHCTLQYNDRTLSLTQNRTEQYEIYHIWSELFPLLQLARQTFLLFWNNSWNGKDLKNSFIFALAQHFTF